MTHIIQISTKLLHSHTTHSSTPSLTLAFTFQPFRQSTFKNYSHMAFIEFVHCLMECCYGCKLRWLGFEMQISHILYIVASKTLEKRRTAKNNAGKAQPSRWKCSNEFYTNTFHVTIQLLLQWIFKTLPHGNFTKGCPRNGVSCSVADLKTPIRRAKMYEISCYMLLMFSIGSPLCLFFSHFRSFEMRCNLPAICLPL